jgi:hypothetical protein
MPRITKTEILAAIAERPFAPEHSPDSPHYFENLPAAMQKAIATFVARDFAGGLSGADCRVRYGLDGGKPQGAGHERRKIIRRFGLDSPATIAKSYDAYSSGEPRKGSAHASNYGPLAAERLAAKAAEQAKAEKAAEQRAKTAAKRAAAKAAKAAEQAAEQAASEA